MNNTNKNMNNQSKTVFITGSTFGIGEATSKYLASKGLNVIIFGRSVENGKRVEKEINELGVGKALFVQGDVTSEEDQRKALEEGEKKFGAIHYAYANAGVWGNNEGLLSNSLKDFKDVFDINFYGSYITLQQVSPFFKKNGGGVIVFCSTMLSLVPRSFFKENGGFASSYFVSKTALDGLVKVATSLEKTHNIKAYSIHPSVYLSGMTNNDFVKPENLAENFNVLFKKYGDPKDLGSVLEHLFDGTTLYPNGQGISCENEYTFNSQYFYDKYATDENLDTEDLLVNHLRDSKGNKLNEKQLEEAKLKIKIIKEEIENKTN